MSSSSRFAAVCLVLICAVASLVACDSEPRPGTPSERVVAEREAFEAEVLAELTALSPDHEQTWREASVARERGDDRAAEEAYSTVLSDLPEFDHALRRRCFVRSLLERHARALEDCEAAYGLVQSPENAAALALALSRNPSERGRIHELARSVIRAPDVDIGTLQPVCEAAINLEDSGLLGACTRKMAAVAPDTWEAHLYVALERAQVQEFGEAREALERSRELGLDPAIYDEFSEQIDRAEGPLIFYGKRVGLGVLAWFAIAAVLVFAGFVLSRLTLREAERALGNPAASASASDSPLHKAYAAVLWLCCAYYYVSVPLVLLTVIALGAGIVLALLYIGHIPIKLIVIVVVVVFGTVGAVVKSFFKRPNEADPGEGLDLEQDAPGLRVVLDEVAGRVGTRPVDRVFLEVGAEVAVFERGGMLEKLRGKGERCLLLGVAALDGLDQRAFKAILAHEYGHFSNEDTAGGNLALGVRRSVMESAVGLARVGAADWYNPAWLFLNGFNRVFMRISQGASRLQEVLADRWSARCYGADSFERGLRHVIAADLRFDVHAKRSLQEVFEAKTALANLYTYTPTSPSEDDAPLDIDAEIEKAIAAEPSPYDSHPRPADRFRWAHAIAQRDPDDGSESDPAWALFADRAAIEERMTDVIRARIEIQTGVEIPRALEPAGEAEAEGEAEFEDDTEADEA